MTCVRLRCVDCLIQRSRQKKELDEANVLVTEAEQKAVDLQERVEGQTA